MQEDVTRTAESTRCVDTAVSISESGFVGPCSNLEDRLNEIAIGVTIDVDSVWRAVPHAIAIPNVELNTNVAEDCIDLVEEFTLVSECFV